MKISHRVEIWLR